MNPRNDAQRIILLSGHVSAGKTTLAHELATRIASARIFSSRAVLEHRLEDENRGRRSLQLLGERLDRETEGAWLSEAVAEQTSSALVVVDAVRIPAQVTAFADRFASLIHVHLKAPRAVLEARYAERQARQPDVELSSYEDVLSDSTEAAVGGLAENAALVVDTYRLSAAACAQIVLIAAASTDSIQAV